MTHTIEKPAVSSLVRCINKNKFYASDAETAEWLKTPAGAHIQQLINTLREQDQRPGAKTRRSAATKSVAERAYI